jgi:hypothetical protein
MSKLFCPGNSATVGSPVDRGCSARNHQTMHIHES